VSATLEVTGAVIKAGSLKTLVTTHRILANGNFSALTRIKSENAQVADAYVEILAALRLIAAGQWQFHTGDQPRNPAKARPTSPRAAHKPLR
jgi:hypothetical protein